ncbi:MAG: hypothetical protein J6H18_02690 [Lachnospiraceae bacterium]|nr:hypothetical protein [Lachnospiraceae bacterium]
MSPRGRKTDRRQDRRNREQQPAWLWLLLLLFLSALTAMAAVSCGKQEEAVSAVPPSLVRRAPLTEEFPRDGVLYTDRLGWLTEFYREAESGLRYFRETTGVQPYLYLRSALGKGSYSQEELDRSAEILYDSLFHDDLHLLILVDEQAEREEAMLMGMAVGKTAASVMDREAREILRAYWQIDLGESRGLTSPQKAAAMGTALRRTADNIMMVQNTSGWIWLLLLLTVGLLLMAAWEFRKNWLKQKQESRTQKENPPSAKNREKA